MTYESAIHMDGQPQGTDVFGNAYITFALGIHFKEAGREDRCSEAVGRLAQSFRGFLEDACKDASLIMWRQHPRIDIDGDKAMISCRLYAYPVTHTNVIAKDEGAYVAQVDELK